ncbi:putative secreted protein with PEP-CTERM sorting signal [Pseudoduganella lurida]|uniref:Putative secreted protein with PEP-CTERM sorting signal n=1 Tax=Pseudoduganella lurida TaxID=1036180 RepID=A0A562RC41_9BURK|nr:CHRD domain-containing protein [Pseudoduganella lurida]TWI66622.1 putative secreted protein with PEP-CTERM sorting signal [Pseudoduganella lurida]
MNHSSLRGKLLQGVAALALCLAGLDAGAAVYTTTLSGANEAPPNASPGTGTAVVDFDIATHTLTLDVAFAGLLEGTTAAHIHCCTAIAETGTAGVATQVPTFVDFPLGVTSGSYRRVFDTSLAATWNAGFITANGGTTAGAEAALLAGLDTGRAYLNLHTSFAPAGEIRGFLEPVPEPAEVALLAVGAPLVLLAAQRRRRGGAQAAGR